MDELYVMQSYVNFAFVYASPIFPNTYMSSQAHKNVLVTFSAENAVIERFCSAHLSSPPPGIQT